MNESTARDYDAIIIGAGMSGLGAGLRLSLYDKKVLILEKHSISGGLNSYYTRFKRPFDVGLHAMTNFVPKGERKKPLGKLLKQLRIPHDDLKLAEQNHSEIRFPAASLTFTNTKKDELPHDLIESVEREFPTQREGFLKLIQAVKDFDDTNLNNEYISARSVLAQFLSEPTLIEMILSPLLIYGSAWEHDMDYSQFVIMFKSIYLEGFCRPQGGVRTILNLFIETYRERGGEIEFRHGVEKILTEKGRAYGVETKKGEVIKAPVILSSMGAPETYDRVDEKESDESARVGRMTFTESIFVTDKKPKDFGLDSTIIFSNRENTYNYRNPETFYDPQSAVVCFPNNFATDDYDEGIIRVTFMANYDAWKNLSDKKTYRQKKDHMAKEAWNLATSLFPNPANIEEKCSINCQDTFTPTTIERYTKHFGGTVYGSPDKKRDGQTGIEGLYLCGTDQGFLGIVGSVLSGISMANLYGLMR